MGLAETSLAAAFVSAAGIDDGLYLGERGSNRFPSELLDAAESGIEELWEYLRTNDPPSNGDRPDTDTEDEGEGTGQNSREAVESLAGEAATETQIALEEPTAELGRFLDDQALPLDPEHEAYLRIQLDTIRLQLRLPEPDRFVVERCLALIVARLAEIGQVGSGVRALLEELGAEPPELVDTIVETMQAMTAEIVESWGQLGSDDQAGPIESVGTQADTLTDALDEVSASISDVQESIEDIRTELDRKPNRPHKVLQAMKTAGTVAGGAKAAEMAVRLRVDQVLLRFYEAISRFWEYWTPFV